MTRILYICNKNDVFLRAYIKHLDPSKYQIQVLSLATGEFIDIVTGKVDLIVKIKDSYSHVVKYALRYLCALLFILRYAIQKFEIIHVLNIKRENFFIIPFFHKRSKRIIITVFGRSTYLYPSKRILFALIYKFVDLFVFSNQSIIKEFSLINNKVPVRKLIEGIPPISSISLIEKEHWKENILEFINKHNIDRNLIKISCSSTISSYDQHDKVIEAISNLKGKNKVQLLFLLSYGGTKEQQQRIIDKIERDLIGFNFLVFTSFLTDSDLASYRALTDIYINMRTSDQLAGAILESLHEGALLISGKWLNYETLDNLGIHYKKVGGFEELSNCVDESIENFSAFKNNYRNQNIEKISNEFSIEVVMKRWNAIYQK